MLVSQSEFVISAVMHKTDFNIFIFYSREKWMSKKNHRLIFKQFRSLLGTFIYLGVLGE